MQRYNEIKNSFVKTIVVLLSFVFIAGITSATKVFADEPGSVFLWGGYDDDGLFGSYAEEHGSPEYSIFGDAEEGLQKLLTLSKILKKENKQLEIWLKFMTLLKKMYYHN